MIRHNTAFFLPCRKPREVLHAVTQGSRLFPPCGSSPASLVTTNEMEVEEALLLTAVACVHTHLFYTVHCPEQSHGPNHSK